jgi:hypothetical protein
MDSVKRGALALLVFGAAAIPAVAFAGTSAYAPADNARTFASGAGGWEGSSSSEGVCVEQLNCPTLTNSWESSGGTRGGGDGHLRTRIENLAGAESLSRGVWRSPVFEYHGADGEVPGAIRFEIAHRTDLSALLANTGSSASFAVQMVDARTGVGRTLVDDAKLGAVEDWTRTKPIEVAPSSLRIGRDYRLKITSTFETAARVFPDSYVDYDDVRLRALAGGGDGGSGGGGGAGGSGGGSAGGGNGDGAGGAVLQGKRLFLRLKCLGVAKKGRCKVRAVAYSKRGKKGSRMTFPIERRVSAKKGKKVTLRVRPRFVDDLAKSKKVMVRSKIRAGDERKTKFRRYKLTEAR